MSEWAERLLRELGGVGSAFDADELAYLALTSKIEHAVRDRLAWRLQIRGTPSLVVAREWRRADLAIIIDESAEAIVEAKAMYSFDAISHTKRAFLLAKIRYDLAKARNLAPAAEAFALVLSTHAWGPVPAALSRHVIKYSSGIEGLQKSFDTSSAAQAEARRLMDEDLRGLSRRVARIDIVAGSAFGLLVAVDAWLVGPVEANYPGTPNDAGAAGS